MVTSRFDAIVVGAGHNGLVAATLLARAGQRVLVLERAPAPGGAAVSASPFAGVDARISRYSYLVSLFPRALARELGIAIELRQRRVSSYTPVGDAGLLVGDDRERTRASFERTLGASAEHDAMEAFAGRLAPLAQPLFDSLTAPLVSRRQLGADTAPWLFERPIGKALAAAFADDTVRGIVATDALIGTFASLHDPSLVQNRCFLYHVIGNGNGRWDVPVGGMGAVSAALARAASDAGAQLRLGTPALAAETGGAAVTVRCGDGQAVRARHLLCGASPTELARLLGAPAPTPPEGSQLKLNLLLARLPRLRDPAVSSEEAFAGTFHVHEGYDELERAHAQAAAGQIPALAPCEAYCHSLTDPSILGPSLRAAGGHTLTVFVLHMPARLFRADPDGAKQAAVAAALQSLNSVLAEPIEDCLWRDAHGRPCLEAHTPPELEAELGLPGGHIFHRDLSWPFAASPAEVGTWGVETEHERVWLCGAGARRGGGVSGIPGHNAARAVLAADA